MSQVDLAATSQALATARDTVVAASANLERRLSGVSREIVRVLHDVLPSGSAVRTASKVVEATSATVGQVKEGLQASRLLFDRERREVEALRHEHTIMFAKHCQIYYPEAHPRIRRPTVEPALPAGMHYVDVSHLPLRPDDLDIDSGREEDRGVCHLVAPLAAFAHRQSELLLNCVRLDRGKVVVTVPGGQYRLDPTLPASRATGALAGISMTGGHTLMAFVEKAFAAEHGSYETLGAGMSPNQAMSWLGGRRTAAELTRDFQPDDLAQLLSHPERLLTTATVGLNNADRATDAQLARRYDAVVGEDLGHAFTLRHVDAAGHVHLRNTWGRRDPDPIPLDDFPRVFPVVFWEAIYGDPPPPSTRTFRL